jgi:hypothetical protein
VAEIRLLDFFRSGQLGGASIGMTYEEVAASLGTPEMWWDGKNRNSPGAEARSSIWVYGGIELLFLPEQEPRLDMISFAPSYLFRNKISLDRWVFRTRKGPSCRRLKKALKTERISYQDTGLEMVVFKEKMTAYEVVPFDETSPDLNLEDVFGTLILASGVQIRYAHDYSIVMVKMGSVWGFQGSESRTLVEAQ